MDILLLPCVVDSAALDVQYQPLHVPQSINGVDVGMGHFIALDLDLDDSLLGYPTSYLA